ncbi:hypothetical protein F5146DRAFT_760215 [Armillaria mellea]|nr:hypothetical protein F5146DRAFT_760215 [Armillaria mellea]
MVFCTSAVGNCLPPFLIPSLVLMCLLMISGAGFGCLQLCPEIDNRLHFKDFGSIRHSLTVPRTKEIATSHDLTQKGYEIGH